jgi:murein DD-endopeptidase MepM/ murein hydrolase activator NlpD
MTRRGRLWFVVFLLALGAGAYGWVRAEGEAPAVRAPESLLLGAAGTRLEVEADDARSGLRTIDVVLALPGGEETLLHEEYPGSLLRGGERGVARAVSVAIDAGRLGGDGAEGFLRIAARDWSLRGLLSGNATLVEVPVRLDLTPPRVSIETGLSYAQRGGAGVVVYSVSEPTVRDGVRVGEAFFRGFPYQGRRAAFYAVPTDAPSPPRPEVVAVDAAGNERTARWPLQVKERALPEATVQLPASFLEEKVPDLARAANVPTDDLTAAFQEVNTRVRSENERRIREIASRTAPERLWQGPFQQWANSQVTSRFAERRTYLVDGKGVSQATHFGYDLATTAGAPITAANSGRVLHAGDLGIYGNCVIVDHGLGVVSLYGHLSSLEVQEGDAVEKGSVLGRSGDTGLAGGDHLHFAILVGDAYVDPVEWWDEKWVREKIDEKLAPPAS